MRQFQPSKARNAAPAPTGTPSATGMRLNKFLAHAGIGTRREAGDSVKNGQVTVNGKTERNPGYSVTATDEVAFKGKPVQRAGGGVFLLLNKPKGIAATPEDSAALRELFPTDAARGAGVTVTDAGGATDLGLVLLTDDAAAARRLTGNPQGNPMVYELTLNRDWTGADAAALEEGPLRVDWANLAKEGDARQLTLRVRGADAATVRAAFAELDLTVERLDRTFYAGLTKKDLPRGFYRFLGEEEVRFLRHFS